MSKQSKITTAGVSHDGIAFSNYTPLNITILPDNPPVVTTTNISAAHGQSLTLLSLFSAGDAEGDTITKYQLWDTTTEPNSGHFVVNGVAQAPRTVIEISASQLAQVNFVAGSIGDHLQIRAYDGIAWSAVDSAQWSPFNVTVAANRAPVLTTSDVAAQRNQTLAVSSLFTVSDTDNDTITRYQL
ncbi:MAG: hypothetical protein H0U98_13900 [Alphaproteobacteria bacterium]|nr:hypothetical protein [Alphaproteobacteria bacterium]